MGYIYPADTTFLAMFYHELALKNSPHHDLEKTLRSAITGEVRFDETTRLLYSTDASIYQIEPLGVAFPRNLDELAACV